MPQRLSFQLYSARKFPPLEDTLTLLAMVLAAGKGTPLKVRVIGTDEETAMAAVIDLFERKFDEGE